MSKHVIVVGAGVVGIATALQLRLAGCRVTLLDRGEPAMETSYGNAGAFAVSDIIPLAEPGCCARYRAGCSTRWGRWHCAGATCPASRRGCCASWPPAARARWPS
ncbi:FAD-dependent oxidoreductase [Vogesella fluminis]|uniref:FAD-dependent oxidoreductase n=1 Tax=Vogesella fluminis TaxID=1069161 RepID=UPI00362AB20A